MSRADLDLARHALARLDWPELLDRIARNATSTIGALHVRSLTPRRTRGEVEAALRAADQMLDLLVATEWSPPPIPDSGEELKRLAVEGSVLDPPELLSVAGVLTAARRTSGGLARDPERWPDLARLGEELLSQPEIEKTLFGSFDDAGAVADTASRELRRIRRSLRSSRSSIVQRLDSYARSLPDRIQVPDGSVTVRSGRYCIPVRREGRTEVGGIVHDESATRQTVFVEPPEAIEPMNRLAELERDEAREVSRILRRLTDAVRPHVEELRKSLSVLAEIDSLYARARWSARHGGVRPTFADPAVEEGGADGVLLRLVRVHHPLLANGESPSVPFDLELRGGETVLLVSGPNAGGKTVLLKTIGLTALQAQSGIVPPAAPGTLLPVFRDLYAVVGDDQSVVASLSTFSAQVEGLRLTLDEAVADSLVLHDEIGSSTDPSEGAALAGAILQRLAEQVRLTVATTHLGDLKALATEDPRIVNASLQFDTAALRPTFRLQRDVPGRSYALEIAGRLGLPEDVLLDARKRLGGEQLGVETLLADLERRETELSELVAETREGLERAREREGRAAEAERKLVQAQRALDREGRTAAERYLKQARREVAREIERLREAFETADTAGPESESSFEAVATGARAAVERMYREAREAAIASREGESADGDGFAPREGQRVRSRSLGLEGRVLELREDTALLEAGSMRVEVAFEDLEPAASGEGRSPRPGRHERETHSAGPNLPEIVARPELDLRGMRVADIEPVLLPALDAAIVGDLPALRIIHGKGTYALREEVERLVRGDRRIAAVRPGGFEEGGSGVTVVEFHGGVD